MTSPTKDIDIPEWIQAGLFEPVFKEMYPDFRQTKNFKAKKALSAGENYATIMLRLEADIELKGIYVFLQLIVETLYDHFTFYCHYLHLPLFRFLLILRVISNGMKFSRKLRYRN